MGNFDEAKKFNGTRDTISPNLNIQVIPSIALLMDKEPTNLQAQSLSSLIDKGVARGTPMIDLLAGILERPDLVNTEGYIGMALAGGAAALGAIAIAAIIRRATRK